jgi:hypothetical protein
LQPSWTGTNESNSNGYYPGAEPVDNPPAPWLATSGQRPTEPQPSAQTHSRSRIRPLPASALAVAVVVGGGITIWPGGQQRQPDHSVVQPNDAPRQVVKLKGRSFGLGKIINEDGQVAWVGVGLDRTGAVRNDVSFVNDDKSETNALTEEIAADHEGDWQVLEGDKIVATLTSDETAFDLVGST